MKRSKHSYTSSRGQRAADLLDLWYSLPENTRVWIWIVIVGLVVLCFAIDAIFPQLTPKPPAQ